MTIHSGCKMSCGTTPKLNDNYYFTLYDNNYTINDDLDYEYTLWFIQLCVLNLNV